MTNAFGLSFDPTVPVSWVGVLAADELAAVEVAAVEDAAVEDAAVEDAAASLVVAADAVPPPSSSEPHPAASASVARASAAASFLMDGSPGSGVDRVQPSRPWPGRTAGDSRGTMHEASSTASAQGGALRRHRPRPGGDRPRDVQRVGAQGEHRDVVLAPVGE